MKTTTTSGKAEQLSLMGKEEPGIVINPQVTNIQIFISEYLTYHEQVSIGGADPTAFFIESDFLDFNQLEELKANREKPEWMTDEEYVDYLKGEDEWIYKMQKIALDAEERQQNLLLERDQKKNDFKA